jgi:hypothetical protein
MPKPYYGPILTEDHWLRSGDPRLMEEFLGERGTQRRWQLFACLCCWRVLPMLDERGRNAVSVAERQAEGLATLEEIREARAEAHAAVIAAWRPGNDRSLAHAANAALFALSSPRRAYSHIPRSPGPGESLAQCQLMRELFGNPFRPFFLEPAWRTPTVLTIASQVYERESFEELPVLGDALEDAGCDDQQVLGHLRAATTHYRGCWALDAVLDKP